MLKYVTLGNCFFSVALGTDRTVADTGRILRGHQSETGFARPLWVAYMRCVEAGDKVNATIQLAMKKLLVETPEWVTRDVAVAVFACLIELDVVAWGTLARHMKTMVKIFKNGIHGFRCKAAAAAKLLSLQFGSYFCEFIFKLIEVCVDGEIVARLVMLLAMHECTKSENYIKPITLSE